MIIDLCGFSKEPQEMDDQTKFIIDALTAKMKELLREEVEGIHKELINLKKVEVVVVMSRDVGIGDLKE